MIYFGVLIGVAIGFTLAAILTAAKVEDMSYEYSLLGHERDYWKGEAKHWRDRATFTDISGDF